MKISNIKPEYVDRIPKVLSEGVLYISEKYSTAAHSCCCGCGNKIVTPLKPGRWSLKKKGIKLSLSPSIGNWSLACQSHYWIEDNAIRWSVQFTESQIHANRVRDKFALEVAHTQRQKQEQTPMKQGRWWEHVRKFIRGWL